MIKTLALAIQMALTQLSQNFENTKQMLAMAPIDAPLLKDKFMQLMALLNNEYAA